MAIKIDWRKAAQGGLIYVLGLFVIVGVLYIGLSYGVSVISDTNSGLLAAGLHSSPQRTFTLKLILNYWYVIPIVVAVLGFVYIIKYGLESDQGGNAY